MLLLLLCAPVVAQDRATTEELLEALQGKDPIERSAAASALGDRPSAMEGVQAVLKAKRGEVRAAAAFALGRMGIDAEEAVPDLLNAFDPPDAKVREVVAHGLAGIGDGAVGPTVTKLSDERACVRAGACVALGYLAPRARSAVPALSKVLGADAEGEVRKFAAVALTRVADPRGGPALSKATSDPRWQVRKAAVEGLGQLREAGKKGLGRLAKAAGDREPEVRLATAIALGRVGVGDRRTVKPLTRLLRDPNKGTRDEAARALGGLGVTEATEPLVAALEEGDGVVRRSIVRALGKLGPKAASARARLAVVSQEDPDKRVRKAAVRALRAVTGS